MDIVKTFLDMALLGSAWVLWLLLFLSVGSVALILERIVFYSRLRSDFADFSRRLTEFLVDGKQAEAEKLCEETDGFEAQVALAGFKQKAKGVQAMEETMASFMISERQNLDRGLVILGTLGSNAPFIGLFGTVIGIIEAFHSLGLNPAGGASAVMAGISEALVATAVGLIVAIPAVIAFNSFQRVVRGKLANGESIQKMIVANASRS